MNSHTVGAVLVGGDSRRMGSPKAELEYLGVPFVDHAAASLSVVTEKVIVVGRGYTGNLATVPDEIPDAGPLGGIVSALRYADPHPVLVLAVDLPLVSIRLLRQLTEPLVGEGQIRMATDGKRNQPLCATWGSGLEAPLASYLERGERSVLGFVDTVADVTLISTDTEALTNINTPNDYATLHGGGQL
jgi:molybdopterin-guanine dinucleotide biosynthesis protein A